MVGVVHLAVTLVDDIINRFSSKEARIGRFILGEELFHVRSDLFSDSAFDGVALLFESFIYNLFKIFFCVGIWQLPEPED